ncbi:NUDIX hydrolase [Patescibacteria group bacterium]|nr:NUDIX hydrolase [Patescibacteria group bacterium]
MKDNMVRSCADAMVLLVTGWWIFAKVYVLLGKRQQHPHPNWWVVGGKMWMGLSFVASVVKNVAKELKLNLDPSRFENLNRAYSLAWATRREEPVNNGCHDVSHLLVAEISAAEASRIKHNKEYSEVAWVELKLVASGRQYHSSLRRMARDVIEFRHGPLRKTLKIWVDWFKQLF